MKYIVNTEFEWHKLRRNVITASSAAVLVGADPYSSPKSIIEPDEFTGNAYTFVGQMLEPIVVQQTNKLLGTQFELYEQEANVKEFYINGYLGATPDAHEQRKTLLECKTVNAKTYLKYSSVPPNKYVIQLITQSICTELYDDHYLAMMNTGLKTMNQYEQFLKNPVLDQEWDISVFKILHNVQLCDIIKSEAERFRDCAARSKQYRVNSALKQKVKLLIPTLWEKII